jgi:hypothetical protein
MHEHIDVTNHISDTPITKNHFFIFRSFQTIYAYSMIISLIIPNTTINNTHVIPSSFKLLK